MMEDIEMTTPGLDMLGDPAQGGLSQEEMRNNLSELMNGVQSKYSELNSEVFSNKNAADSTRQETIREALEMLQAAGVDLNDPESINQFMQRLNEMNPDLFMLFEDALNKILAGDGFEPEAEGMDMGGVEPDIPMEGQMPPVPPGGGMTPGMMA